MVVRKREKQYQLCLTQHIYATGLHPSLRDIVPFSRTSYILETLQLTG